jgi:hypothetical protein
MLVVKLTGGHRKRAVKVVDRFGRRLRAVMEPGFIFVSYGRAEGGIDDKGQPNRQQHNRAQDQMHHASDEAISVPVKPQAESGWSIDRIRGPETPKTPENQQDPLILKLLEFQRRRLDVLGTYRESVHC